MSMSFSGVVIVWQKGRYSTFWEPVVCRTAQDIGLVISRCTEEGAAFIITQPVEVTFSAEVKPTDSIPVPLIPDMVVEKLLTSNPVSSSPLPVPDPNDVPF